MVSSCSCGTLDHLLRRRILVGRLLAFLGYVFHKQLHAGRDHRRLWAPADVALQTCILGGRWTCSRASQRSDIQLRNGTSAELKQPMTAAKGGAQRVRIVWQGRGRRGRAVSP